MEHAMRLELAGDHAGALALYDRAIPKIPEDRASQRAEAFVRLGDCLLRLEMMTDAFNSFQRAVELDPSNLDARRRVAELLIAGGLPERALEHADYILANKPGDAAALALLGAAAATQGDADRAEEYYRRSLSADPTRVNVSVALAESLRSRARLNDARTVLLASAAAVPASSAPWLALGRLEEQEGLVVPAEAAYRAAIKAQDVPETNARLAQFLQRIGRIEDSLPVLARLDEHLPKDPPALADLQLSLGKAQEAFAIYGRRLISILATETERSEQRRLIVRMIESQLESGGSLAHARSLLRQSAGLLDKATEAVLLAEIALEANDVSEAERQSLRAVEQSGDLASTYFVRGLVLHRQGDDMEARSMWGRALGLDPTHLPSLTMMARSELEANQPAEAEKYIIPVIREEPANLKALVLYGRILLAQRRFDDARGIARRAAMVAPSSPEPLVLLGEISIRQNSLASALVEFQKAIILAPESSQALDGLLRVYRSGNFTRPMLRKLEHVAEAPPRSATLYEIAGRLYAENGWNTDAVRALKRAIQIDAQRASAALALTQTYSGAGDLRSAAEVALNSAPLNRISPGSTSLLAALDAESRMALSESEQDYELAIQRGEATGVAANNLAWRYAEQGKKLDRALELALSAHAKDPENAAMLDTLGYVRLKRGEYTAAVEALKKAERLSDGPTRTSIRAHLQEAYTKSGI
jgi:tetratricopeptide (TPR) repeat protein